MDICEQFGKNVKKYRNERNYTTAELANTLNVSVGLINNIENARNDVFKLELLLNLIQELNVSLEELVPSKENDVRKINFFNTNNLEEYTIDLINDNLNLITNSFLTTLSQYGYTEDKIKTISSHIIQEFDFIKKLNSNPCSNT